MEALDARTRLRRLGQLHLGDYIEIATGEELWNKQHEIAEAISQPHAQVVVPSCNASGKTWLAGRIALAFYDSYRPGTPCEYCDPSGTGSGCRGAKVITTSSKEQHLEDNLWGEIRLAWARIKERHGIDGRLLPKDTKIEGAENWFITGLVATSAEGFQGYHAAHILVIGDEATAVSDEIAQGIIGLLASGDARLLLILNPTDENTYAAAQARSPFTTTIKIDAFSTPNFTGEKMPDGAHLIHPGFLERLKAGGMGPGTYEWTTRVLAEFWKIGDDTLVSDAWFNASLTNPWMKGTVSLGIDLASYGTNESVIAVRDGNVLVDIMAFPAGRVDHFFQGPVTAAVKKWNPDYVIYDADGVGAGAIGYAEALLRSMRPGGQVIGFRGAKNISPFYTNARSAWYWSLRKMFEADHIAVAHDDPTLREQLTVIRYSIVQGAIRVETKDEMRRRGVKSPDRADAVMYAFSFATELPTPVAPETRSWVEDELGLHNRSEEAMWEALDRQYDEPMVHPLLGVTDW
jgi:phage terminase large subunit